MADVVLIHGIAQEQLSADRLENDWIPNMAGGIREAGFPDVADRLWHRREAPDALRTRMAFYGSLFLRQDQQGGADGGTTADEEAIAERLAAEWLARAADSPDPQARATAQQELASLASDDDRQGVRELSRRAVGSLCKIRWFAPFGLGFAELFVWRALAQMSAYLSDDSIREAALSKVSGVMGPETKVIVGHSLGSVIAFEAAHRLERDLALLVTIGSPLGLRNVIYERLRPQPPTYPARVRRWVNVASRDDIAASEPDLTHLFSGGIPDGAVFEGGFAVDNGAQPHSATFYLGKQQVGRPIGEVLAA